MKRRFSLPFGGGFIVFVGLITRIGDLGVAAPFCGNLVH